MQAWGGTEAGKDEMWQRSSDQTRLPLKVRAESGSGGSGQSWFLQGIENVLLKGGLAGGLVWGTWPLSGSAASGLGLRARRPAGPALRHGRRAVVVCDGGQAAALRRAEGNVGTGGQGGAGAHGKRRLRMRGMGVL